jgi:hypothetical protein
VNTEHEQRLLTRTRDLLSDTRDLGTSLTVILGAARAARLDPDALTGLAVAAVTLGATQLAVRTAGDNSSAVFSSDQTYLAAVSGAEDDVSDQLTDAQDLRRDTATARDTARADLDDARGNLADARAMPVSRPCDGCHHDRADAIADARHDIAACKERIRLCATVIRVLDPLTERLETALRILRAVPGELADTYEPAYEVRQAGRQLPKDGDFLTGHPA